MLLESDQSPGQSPSPERRKAPRREEDRRLLRRDRALNAARRLADALFDHLNDDDLSKVTLHAALEVVNGASGSILLADFSSQTLVFRYSLGAHPVKPLTTLPWDRGIAGRVFRSGEPLVIKDVHQNEQFCSDIDLLTNHVTRDLIAVPLKRWEGDPIGVLEVVNKREGVLDEEDLAVLMIVSAFAAGSIERARHYEEAKLAEVAGMLGQVGHDIKNLLMPVVTGAGLLKDGLIELFEKIPKNEKAEAEKSYQMGQEVLGMIDTSSRRIHDRVKEMADCVKGLSTVPDFAECHVAAVAEAVVETLRRLADQQGLTLRREGLDSLPSIMADERRLFNALYNLVNNAIPETPNGGSITISGREDPPGQGLLLTVADTGRGMAPEVKASLFSLHAKSRKVGGTGLGTKIVKDVVDAHGGRISVESELGVGSTFYLYLPLRPPTCSATPS